MPSELPVNVSINPIDKSRIQVELRRKFVIKKNTPDFFIWKKIFSKSIIGKSVKIEFIISFRDKLFSALKLEELGLIDPYLKIDTIRKKFDYKKSEPL